MPETAHFQAAQHKIIKTLAQAGHDDAALRVAEAVFQIFKRDGELATLFDLTMYEHYMMGAVNHLTKVAPHLAITSFSDHIIYISDLLLHASRMDRRLSTVREEDYWYSTVGSLQRDQIGGGDFLATLIRAIVKMATSAVEADPANVHSVLKVLSNYKPRIFRRIALHALALAPGEAPDVADRYLTDTDLIKADWCQQEYAELARAWLSHLPLDRQKFVFDFIDSVPEAFLDNWHSSFEQYEMRKPTAEEDRKYRETTIRDIVWEWRDALPADRRAALDKTIGEFGDPEAWRVARDQSPLSRASMQYQTVEDTVAYLETWCPDPQLHAHTAGGLANELREAVAAKPEAFSAAAAKFGRLRPLFIRHLLDGLRQATANGAKVDWVQCLELVKCILELSEGTPDSSATIPGDDPDWSWAVRSAVEWLASALGRGADGVAFIHDDTVRMVALGLYHRVARLPTTNEDARVARKDYPYIAALQTARGATINLCVLLLYWQSKNPASAIGQAPRDALARALDVRAIFETELQDRSASGWIPRAILARYLTWLFFFGEDWLRSQMTNLFPSDNQDLRDAAWLEHLQYDQPVGKLVGVLHLCYTEHIATLGRDNSSPGYEESKHRLVQYLMILYLNEELPEFLLRQFWDSAPVDERRHAMWFMGRHMVPTSDVRTRAMSYWDRRLQSAVRANDPEPYRKELGIIGHFFIWDVDPF
jgi:hypothetical protein